MASGDVQLLTVWVSPYAIRAEVALFVKGVHYTKLPQDLSNKSPLLLQSNPVYKKIPVLLHHGKPICESMVIVQYVDEAFPSPDGHDLLPKDPHEKAVARFWADFVDKKIIDNLFRLLRTQGDEQKAAREELKGCLSTLEEAFGTVPKEPPYFGGAKIGIVDVVLAPLIAWYEVFETICKFQFEFDKLPRLAAWMKAMRESPCGQEVPEPQKVTEFVTMMMQRMSQAAQAEAESET